ncbi:MAG: hypothetical protein P4M14_06565 [Gammaproteobacteria bacterium]|nr:hypothetical protein [Gammaproteobacteria bacterium]
MKPLLIIALFLLTTFSSIGHADQTNAACRVYTAIQDGTKINDVKSIIQSENDSQTLIILRGYRWKFDNGDVAYVEFNDRGEATGQSDLRSQNKDMSATEREFNDALLNQRLTLTHASGLLGDGEFIEYDFTDSFPDGTTITGFADKDGNVLAISIKPSCGGNISNSKSFQYSTDAPNNLYEKEDSAPAANTNTNTVSDSYPVFVPFYFDGPYRPYHHDRTFHSKETPPKENNTVKQPNAGQRIMRQYSPNMFPSTAPIFTATPNTFPTSRPAPPYNVPRH